MASPATATHTVTPVVAVQPEKKNDKGFVIALHDQTEKILTLSFDLQDSYENQTAYAKDALHDAAVMFLKAQCQRSIAQWDNLVSKMTKVQKYSAMNRQQIEDALKQHPKFSPFYKTAERASVIKASLK